MDIDSLSVKLKTFEGHFGRIVSTVKHLKTCVDKLQEQVEAKNANKEVNEILEAQKVIDEVIVANSDAINQIKQKIGDGKQRKGNDYNLEGNKVNADAKCIKEVIARQQEIDRNIFTNADVVNKLDQEIKNILKDKTKKEESRKKVDDAIEKLNLEILQLKQSDRKVDTAKDNLVDSDKIRKKSRCRYFNSGYCKYKERCKFKHPERTCPKYSDGECKGKDCEDRHPKPCKYFSSKSGCKRGESCNFSHDTLAHGEHIAEKVKNEMQNFTCVSCRCAWKDRHCVVRHVVKHNEVFFCLNCEDWVKEKSRVLDNGWSLYDKDGNLDHFV